MRIALLAFHFAEYVTHLALALSREHEVLLLLNADNAQAELTDELRVLLHKRVTVQMFHRHPIRHPRFLPDILAINRIIRDFSPEVLHIQAAAPYLMGWSILSFCRSIPIVLTVHDHIRHSGQKKLAIWRSWLYRLLESKVHRVIVHGLRIKIEIERLRIPLAGRVDAIPHGILGSIVASDDVSGYEPGTFLFFGRIEVYKGLVDLLDACQVLHDRGHAFRLIVAGRGSDLDNHRERIASSPWVALIERYISAAEIPELFRRASAAVLPYTDATQSGVSAMAFAFARPVIATRTGALPEVVIDGQTGLLVPPRDPNALADAMEKLLVDGRLRDSLATGAARFAKETLSWVRIADMTCDTYRRAISAFSVDRNLE